MSTGTSTPRGLLPGRSADLLGGPARGLLLSMSKDPDAKLTFVTTSGSPAEGRVAVKVSTTPRASLSVEAEGRALVGLRRMPLGTLHDTVPRYVDSFHDGSTAVLVSTVVRGTPMSAGYHQWLHTARPARVRDDFRRAATWLDALWGRTTGPQHPLSWPRTTRDELAGRWDGHRDLPAALDRLEVATEALGRLAAPATAVHGDFWFGNVLVTGDEVSGVVDWESATLAGCPLRDLARFALSYCLYLDRHTRRGARVLGHPGLRREAPGAGVRYGLLGASWFSATVRDFLSGGLESLGLPRQHWYDVALVGLAEVAATANDETFGAEHLSLLAGLPAYPRVERRRG